MKNSTLSILSKQTWRNRKANEASPTGAAQTDLNAKNDFLQRLGTLAYAVDKSKETDAETEARKEKEAEKYSSRFFFILPEDFAEANRNTTGIEQLPEEPFNLEVVQRAESYKDNIGKPVKHNMDIVCSFILKEITPLLLGLDGGIEQARSIIYNTVSDCDPYPFTTLELLTREAVKIKLASFIADYFDLGEDEVEKLVAKILPPKQREVVVPVPMNYGASSSGSTTPTKKAEGN